MADEFARIARLTARFQRVAQPHVLRGIGDDAALLLPGSDNLVLSVDAAVEGVHFERRFAALDTLAARAFSAAVSDLAAMGAQPRAALSALVLPADLQESDFDAVIEGLSRASARYACPVVGGNLAGGSQLGITTTVLGAVRGMGLGRDGARCGDLVYVTGSLGDAALGLSLLQLGAAERGPYFVERWRNPSARVCEGIALLGMASAAIDVSDGALQDLGHLCERSGLGAELEAARLPLSPGFAQLARALERDPLELALCGGEDYELIYTATPDAACSGPGTCIGRMTQGTGVIVRDERGDVHPLGSSGYRHFAR